MNIYPKAQAKDEIVKLDKSTVAASIITAREEMMTKAEAIGVVLNGSNDIDTFNIVWDEVEKERCAFRAVRINDFTTADEYKSKLNTLKTYLDVDTWFTGMLAENNAKDWDELQSLDQ